MDGDYARNFDEHGAPFEDFQHSLFVLTTIMSKNDEWAICDAGLKAVCASLGGPSFCNGSRPFAGRMQGVGGKKEKKRQLTLGTRGRGHLTLGHGRLSWSCMCKSCTFRE